jgi:ABC-2 type transport system ATP-binding protein
MIRAESLSKQFGRIQAVDDINFHIEKGEIIGFLGPNGAGKSTTMNMITGYLAPSSGRVLVDGIDMVESPEEAKKRIGYLPEQPPLYLDLTVDEYLNFITEFKKVPKSRRSADLDAIRQLVKIGDVRNRLIKNLSKGYRQRVGLAQALVGNPPAAHPGRTDRGIGSETDHRDKRTDSGLGQRTHRRSFLSYTSGNQCHLPKDSYH